MLVKPTGGVPDGPEEGEERAVECPARANGSTATRHAPLDQKLRVIKFFLERLIPTEVRPLILYISYSKG